MQDAKRGLDLLAASFGLAWVSIAMVAAPGPAAFVALSGRAGDAGVFFALWALGSATGGGVFGRAMDRWGRRRPLVVAHLAGVAGFIVAGVAYRTGALPLFIAGVLVLAVGIGGIFLTRLAAAELFAPAQRAGAVARVQVAATFAAVGGPLLVLTLGTRADGLVWFVAPALYLASAFLVWRWREPARTSAGTAGVSPAPAAPIPLRPLVAGITALLVAQAAMVTVMGVTGVELKHHHTATATAVVMASHFAGMFALSIFVGRIADRVGRRKTILAGVAMMAAGGALVAFLTGALGLALGLLLVGLGWSFAYIAGTVVLTDIVPLHRRARVVGAVDLSTALAAAVASFSGGLWYASSGMPGLGLAAVALVALPALAALPLREDKPGDYASTAS